MSNKVWKAKQKRKSSANPQDMRKRIVSAILRIPRGKVSSYGGVARAAGFPGGARQVAQVLHRAHGLPWQRVVGAGGAIKIPGEGGLEQRFLLQAEGVTFRGRRVDMQQHDFFNRPVRKLIARKTSSKQRRGSRP
jgi:methylated-DNA-protein-cysteine methyltransferase related protein